MNTYCNSFLHFDNASIDVNGDELGVGGGGLEGSLKENSYVCANVSVTRKKKKKRTEDRNIGEVDNALELRSRTRLINLIWKADILHFLSSYS